MQLVCSRLTTRWLKNGSGGNIDNRGVKRGAQMHSRIPKSGDSWVSKPKPLAARQEKRLQIEVQNDKN
jgi:hypothetical protein